MKTRVITGKLKGRVLQLPPAEAARPTRNRILQAAFNMLHGFTSFEGARVLEACCGSGAWGIEAYSRGAAEVVLLDIAPKTAQANITALGIAPHVQAIASDAARYRPAAPFDIILADPPYAETKLIEAILANAPTWGKSGSLWVLETASTSTPNWPAGFTVQQTRTYGASAIHIAVWK